MIGGAGVFVTAVFGMFTRLGGALLTGPGVRLAGDLRPGMAIPYVTALAGHCRCIRRSRPRTAPAIDNGLHA